jgi:hypothetical protein
MKKRYVLQVELELEAKTVDTLERKIDRIVEQLENKDWKVLVEEEELLTDVLDDFDEDDA